LEVGIQTFNPGVAALINRRQDNAKAEETLRFLRQRTSAYVHSDLIVGLPGESTQSFAAGFDRLVELAPHEIQIELLKRLRGAPIARHDAAYSMEYSGHPPYEILSTSLIDANAMQRLGRLARYWDLYFNSRNFTSALPWLWAKGEASGAPSPFAAFAAFSDWLFSVTGQTHALALDRLAELLHNYLVEQRGLACDTPASALAEDFLRCRRRLPPFLRRMVPSTSDWESGPQPSTVAAPPRQARSR
jgi:hypothetical protein